VDPDAVWDGAWDWSSDGVLDRGGDRRREMGSLGVNLGHAIVTNKDFVA